MAAPHVAGVAALAGRPTRAGTARRAPALVSTADPAKVAGYNVSRGGVGLVDTAQAVGGRAFANGDQDGGHGRHLRERSLSFGFEESAGTFPEGKHTVVNKGKRAVNYRRRPRHRRSRSGAT